MSMTQLHYSIHYKEMNCAWKNSSEPKCYYEVLSFIETIQSFKLLSQCATTTNIVWPLNVYRLYT